MAHLIWSPQAAADLQAICEFIARDSPEYARLFAGQVVGLVESIPDHPQAGRVVPEMETPELRERLLSNYRIVYRLKKDAVEIVTILHGARLLREM
ncbi:MAG: plasmid stabilization protein [Planctomycetes bacterium DG_20]|nr:MAG: plasmid stabilization protein [Planctomycetes bacterium DG_20]